MNVPINDCVEVNAAQIDVGVVEAAQIAHLISMDVIDEQLIFSKLTRKREATLEFRRKSYKYMFVNENDMREVCQKIDLWKDLQTLVCGLGGMHKKVFGQTLRNEQKKTQGNLKEQSDSSLCVLPLRRK
ncbi:unnamed protein product [Microthlaspi erraticum]|uniref:Uncharacterized protein n=1 Tax=Microthlaspi erraticum TaxID=1685480 RepID=A0A6D2J9T4_9BRAS|nr:unnamed protein product [Microthlaspi erraticum]